MSAGTNNTASVHVTITMYMSSSEQIPKNVEIFDSHLNLIDSGWIRGKEYIKEGLKKGIYVVRLSLSSGLQKETTVELQEGERKDIEINIGIYSPHETHEWAYLSKNSSGRSAKFSNLKEINYNDPANARQADVKVWENRNNTWQLKDVPGLSGFHNINIDGYTHDFSTDAVPSILEIAGSGMPATFVNLPPQSKLYCLIRFSEGKDAALYPLDVTISTTNTVAETLLALMSSGAVKAAETFTESNIYEAEELLSEKIADPIGATIGAYFILKTGDLSRLHNWASNLANWFTCMSDGSVIHASQLMNEKNKTPEQVKMIRDRLLEAVKRGIPVYSEGLRLLHEGLTQLWYFSNQADTGVKEALDKIGSYVEVSDCSQETTTYTGIAPDQPGRKHRSFSEMSGRFA